MACRLNCACRVCGRVRLHVMKTPRRARLQPVDQATAELDEAMRAFARPREDAGAGSPAPAAPVDGELL